MAKVSGFHPEDAVRPRYFAQTFAIKNIFTIFDKIYSYESKLEIRFIGI